MCQLFWDVISWASVLKSITKIWNYEWRHLWTTPKKNNLLFVEGLWQWLANCFPVPIVESEKKCFRKIKFRPKKKSFHFHPSTSEKWKRMLNEINFVLFALSSDDTFLQISFWPFSSPIFVTKGFFLHGCTFQANYLPVKGLKIEIEEVLETHKQGRPQT